MFHFPSDAAKFLSKPNPLYATRSVSLLVPTKRFLQMELKRVSPIYHVSYQTEEQLIGKERLWPKIPEIGKLNAKSLVL